MPTEDRTDAQITVSVAAAGKGISAERLTNKALSGEIFIKPGTKDSYSLSWVINRLRHNDKKVAHKLTDFAATL